MNTREFLLAGSPSCAPPAPLLVPSPCLAAARASPTTPLLVRPALALLRPALGSSAPSAAAGAPPLCHADLTRRRL
jgi:hypothetical protein